MKKNKIKAKEFDQAFDQGSVLKHLDKGSVKEHYPIQRINIDIPGEILEKVDREANRVGIPRTSLIKVWIAEHVDRLAG